jgi:DNA-binding response OmpR family regulator
LDLGLPGIDGFTACKVIRKLSQVPFILLTGRVSVSDKVFGMEIGAADYITKPFNLDEFWLG